MINKKLDSWTIRVILIDSLNEASDGAFLRWIMIEGLSLSPDLRAWALVRFSSNTACLAENHKEQFSFLSQNSVRNLAS